MSFWKDRPEQSRDSGFRVGLGETVCLEARGQLICQGVRTRKWLQETWSIPDDVDYWRQKIASQSFRETRAGTGQMQAGLGLCGQAEKYEKILHEE